MIDDKHKEFKEAYHKGLPIQSFKNGEWVDVKTPSWWEGSTYRIKHTRQEVMKAYTKGARIQYRPLESRDPKWYKGARIQYRPLESRDPKWYKTDDPAWYDHFEYRVHPDDDEKPLIYSATLTKVSEDKWVVTEHISPTNQQKEITMKFETKYFLNGKDIKEYSQSAIYEIIEETEQRIEALKKIKNQPKSLKEEIANGKAELARLIEFLDAQ